jgi:hypothetical protein
MKNRTRIEEKINVRITAKEAFKLNQMIQEGNTTISKIIRQLIQKA